MCVLPFLTHHPTPQVPEAEAARDAFAMLLYGRLFDHLVKLINKGLSGTGINEENRRFIGVLDIYGFEFFEKNSFEQFCVRICLLPNMCGL